MTIFHSAIQNGLKKWPYVGMTLSERESHIRWIVDRFLDFDCIDIDDVVTDVETNGNRYVLISGGMVTTQFTKHGYPADSKNLYRVFDKQTAMMRIIPYQYCIEQFCFDPRRGRRGLSAVYPVIMIGGHAEYTAIKARHDSAMNQFYKDYAAYIDTLHATSYDYAYERNKYPMYTKNESIIRYREYLKSEAWIAKKWQVFKRDEYQCQKCGTAKNIQCHHLTYEHLYNEPLDDLVTLCRLCHVSIHEYDQEKDKR
jgi:hypothetical protein